MARKKSKKEIKKQKEARNGLVWFIGFFLLVSLVFSGFLWSELQSIKQQKNKPLSPEMADLEIFNNNELSCKNPNLKSADVPLCPQGKGQYFLSRAYPPHSVFVGYMVGVGHHTLLQDLVRAALRMDPPPPVIVLVPQADIQSVKKEIFSFLTPRYKKHVKFLMVPSDITTWVQDYFEQVVDGETFKPSLLDIPYFTSAGDAIPSFVASTCDIDLIPKAEFERKNARYVSGDYGGNIEALSDQLVLVGNTHHQDHLEALIELSAQKMVTVNVEWLDVGHVDEVFSVIPGPPGSDPSCPHKILYASPGLGLNLLAQRQIKYRDRPIPLNWQGKRDDESKFDLRDCFLDKQNEGICRTIFESNKVYEEIMQTNVSWIKEAFKTQDTKCASPEFQPIPVLFSPMQPRTTFGSNLDESRPIDANPVNNILLGNEVFIPRQSIPEFYRYTKSLLGEMHYQVRFVQGYFLHRQGGGIHCNMNVRRACRQALKWD